MKKVIYAMGIVLLLGFILVRPPVVALAQAEVVCDSDVVVQADDWLSKIADKFYGDVLAYSAIADATNAKAATDASYAKIDNVNIIEPGWKLCVPSAEDAQAMLGAAAAEIAASAGGELTIGLAGDLKVLDPYITTLEVYKSSLKYNLFDTLVEWDDGKRDFLPGLATSWEFKDDTTLVFTLREGVTFHNGKEFTADDVKFSVERLKNPELASQYAPQVATVTSAEVLDPYHVQFNFSEPTPSIFAQLLLVPILTAEGIENIGTQPVGTGPFEFVEWIPNDHLTIKKFDGYWKEGLPRLDQIIFRPILDIDTRIANLEAGSVDLIQGVAPKDVERVGAIAGVTLLTTPPIPLYDVIQINTKKPPFDNVNVRRALCFAFDRASFANDIYYGLARSSNSPYTPESWAYDSATEQDCQYDLEKAAQALSDAGHPNGEGVSVEILSPLGYDELKQGGVLLQAALTELGVQASFVELELAAWIDRIAVNPDFDITMDVYEAVPADPALVFNSDLLNPETNISKYKTDEYAGLVKVGATTLDRAERQKIYGDLQKLMLKEVPVVFLAHHPIIWAGRDQVRDFQPNSMAIYGFNTTWQAK